MRAKAKLMLSLVVSLALLGLGHWLAKAAESTDGSHIIMVREDRPDLNFVGQYVNSGATSHQFGYLSKIEGIGNVFNSDMTKNESTAMFTFSTYANNVLVINNGPIRAVNRTGSTTIYFHPEGGANFADPSTFEAGVPIQVSDYEQQVILNPSIPFPFTTAHLNTVTSATSFMLTSVLLRLGRVGDAYRTHFTGSSNTGTPPPSGYFAGYASGVSHSLAQPLD